MTHSQTNVVAQSHGSMMMGRREEKQWQAARWLNGRPHILRDASMTQQMHRACLKDKRLNTKCKGSAPCRRYQHSLCLHKVVRPMAKSIEEDTMSSFIKEWSYFGGDLLRAANSGHLGQLVSVSNSYAASPANAIFVQKPCWRGADVLPVKTAGMTDADVTTSCSSLSLNHISASACKRRAAERRLQHLQTSSHHLNCISHIALQGQG